MNTFYKASRMVVAVFLFNIFILQAQPVISSFSPASGAVGTSVIITGSGFDATASNNVVFFGATRATVNTASTNSLNVTVPAGAAFGSIGITNLTTQLSCLSNSYFTPTFTPSKGNFITTDFAGKVNFATGASPQNIAVGDLDGDGKPEIVTANYHGTSVSVLKNTCTLGTPSFATHVDLTTYMGPAFTTLADMDGDGKLDVVITNSSSGSKQISIFLNTSTVGSLSFAPRFDLTLTQYGYAYQSMAVGDMDGDGKLDIIAQSGGSNVLAFVKNISTSGGLAFTAPTNFTTTMGYQQIAITDVDGDGKNDLVMLASYSNNKISIWRNTLSSGTLSFASSVDYTTDTSPYGMVLGDFDGDGKIDVLTNQSYNRTISAFRNNSTSGTVSFSTSTLNTSIQPYMLALADLDGDGKLDLVVGCANVSSSGISVIHNKSTINNFSIASDVFLTTGNQPYYAFASDLDGDGKPDVIAGNNSDNTVSVLMNNPILTWYSSSSGSSNLQNVSSWWNNSNGTGINPTDFNDPAATFQLSNGFNNNYTVNSNGMTIYGTVNIPSGAKVNLNYSFSNLTAMNSLVNNGTVSGQGSVIMNGTSAQTIAGMGSIGNLTINNSNGVSIASGAGNSQTITGVYTPTAGTLTTNSNLIFQANNSGAANIGQGTGIYINGNVTVQRYIGNTQQWRMVGFPFTPATNITQTALSSAYTSNYAAFYFNEAADNASYGSVGAANAGWINFSSGSITADKGLLLNGGAQNNTVSLSGPINMGTQNISLGYTGTNFGWNLIANPFVSNLNWITIRSNNLSNLDNAIYRWNPNTTAYASYVNGSSTGSQTNVIENGAAFFVHSTGATSLTIKETDKTNVYAASLMDIGNNRGVVTLDGINTSASDNSIIKLSLAKQGDLYADEVVLRWGGNVAATDKFDSELDAYDLGRVTGPDLSVFGFDGTQYSIFHGTALKNSNDENRIVKLGIKNISEGSYQIHMQLLADIANGNKAFLHDSYTNEYTLIDTNAIYHFIVNSDKASQSINRFSIVMNYKTVDNLNTSLPIILLNNPSSGNDFMLYSRADYTQLQWQIVDDNGRTISGGMLNNIQKGGMYSLKTSNTARGNYFIKLNGDSKVLPILKAIKN